MGFVVKDGSGNKFDVFTENEYILEGFGGVFGGIAIISFFASLIFGGLFDVFKYCGNIMIWMLIIVGVISAFFNAISIVKECHPAIPSIIIGILSSVIQFLIMINTIKVNIALGFFNVCGAICVALFEAFLSVLAGFIVGIIVGIIINSVKKHNKSQRQKDNS